MALVFRSPVLHRPVEFDIVAIALLLNPLVDLFDIPPAHVPFGVVVGLLGWVAVPKFVQNAADSVVVTELKTIVHALTCLPAVVKAFMGLRFFF
jgi:hypothetical protein